MGRRAAFQFHSTPTVKEREKRRLPSLGAVIMAPPANSNVHAAENNKANNVYGVSNLSKGAGRKEVCSRPRRMSNEYATIQRTVSDGAALITSSCHDGGGDDENELITRCECCGLSEECTAAYEKKVRELFCGRWICGLCSEAVKEEAQRSQTCLEEALQAHIYNHGFTRTNPALHVAHALRHLLKKKAIPGAAAPTNSRRLPRTASCIPSIK